MRGVRHHRSGGRGFHSRPPGAPCPAPPSPCAAHRPRAGGPCLRGCGWGREGTTPPPLDRGVPALPGRRGATQTSQCAERAWITLGDSPHRGATVSGARSGGDDQGGRAADTRGSVPRQPSPPPPKKRWGDRGGPQSPPPPLPPKPRCGPDGPGSNGKGRGVGDGREGACEEEQYTIHMGPRGRRRGGGGWSRSGRPPLGGGVRPPVAHMAGGWGDGAG